MSVMSDYGVDLFEKALLQNFFARPTEHVARDLIGAILVKIESGEEGNTVLAGRIVETEAYLHEKDAASHSFRGKTPRNAAMFGPPGTLYMYRIYGVHFCANIVTEAEGRGAAVLLRAMQPLAGTEIMQTRRKSSKITDLCSGPAKITQSFALDLADDGTRVTEPYLFVVPATSPVLCTSVSARVGITKDAALPLRFLDAHSPFVSKGKPSV